MDSRPRSILIVLLGSLGDVVRASVIPGILKENLNGVKITWLVEPKCEEVVRLNSEVDKVVVFERSTPVRGFLKVLREFREQRFDVCLDMQRHLKSGIFSFLSRAPRRIGFGQSETKELNWIFNNEYIKGTILGKPKIDRYLEFAKVLNCAINHPLKFAFNTDGMSSQFAYPWGQSPFVSLVLGSSWKSKDWEPEYYVAVAQMLAERGCKIVLIGDSSVEKLSDFIVSKVDASGIINHTGRLSIRELFFVIKKSSVVVGPDTGPGHIASLFNTPYVSLFGATDPAFSAPYGQYDLVLRSTIGCSPCYRRNCPGLNRVCMRLLSPDMVLERVIKLLEKSSAT